VPFTGVVLFAGAVPFTVVDVTVLFVGGGLFTGVVLFVVLVGVVVVVLLTEDPLTVLLTGTMFCIDKQLNGGLLIHNAAY